MSVRQMTCLVMTGMFLLIFAGLARSQDRVSALEAEVKLLRATEKRLLDAKKDLEERVQRLEDENRRLKEIIAKTVPPDKQGPAAGTEATCFVIPVEGQIGVDFTAGMMKRALEQAVELSPTVVVLEIDTPGGSITDAEEIVDMIISYKGLRFVAFVRKAISAGSPITMACKEIYVTDQAVIGAATAWYRETSGLPTALQEKMMSIWRAMARKAAQHGGHSSLFGEAMIDPDFNLTLRKDGEALLVERNGVGKVLKAKGKILTLTAVEAVESGLAKGTVSDLDGLARTLGMGGWTVTRASAVPVATPTGPINVTEGDFTPIKLYGKLKAKFDALGAARTDLTQLQMQRIQKEWLDWLEKEDIRGHKVRWSARMVNVRNAAAANERVRQMVQLAKQQAAAKLEQLNQARRARYHSTKEKNDAIDDAREKAREAQEVVQKLEKQLDELQDYPIEFLGTAPDDVHIYLYARFHKDDLDALSRLAKDSEVTFDGDLSGLVPVPGLPTPAVAVTKCRIARK